MSATDRNSRWQPTRDQVADPDALHRTIRQMLTQHYALQDRVNALDAQHRGQASQAAVASQGPADTKLLGLRVAPIDTSTLPNGALLRWDAASSTFKFS